jgi:DNA modification methylase
MKLRDFVTALWPIGKVKPYEKNARNISDAAVAKVALSLEQYGWRQPIVVDSKGVIVAGHTRLQAAKQLKLKQVPVHVARDLTAAQIRAYRLMDNRSHDESSWNDLLLAPELAELRAMDFDLALTGFDKLEVSGFLKAADLLAAGGAGDPDAVPAAPKFATTEPGDVWICREHRVMCGDSTVLDSVERLCAGEVALIFTDPPYGVGFERGKFVGRDKAAKGPAFAPIANDALNGDDLEAFVRDALVCAFAVAGNAPIYVWSASLEEGYAILRATEAAGFKIQSQIIWRKTPFVIGRNDYHWHHEVCWYGFKGVNHPWYGERNKSTVWDVPKAQRADVHPTMKPVELGLIALKNSSKSGDLVLDLFGGSGSTLIACEQLGRYGRLMELEPRYVDVIVKRWQDYAKAEATLEGDGRTFAAVAGARASAAGGVSEV